jgi:hypothetical protein
MKILALVMLSLMAAQFCTAQESTIPFLGSDGRLGLDNVNLSWDNRPNEKRFRVGPRSGFKDATFPYIINNTQHTFGSINQGKKYPVTLATLMEDDDATAAIAGMEVDVVSRHATGIKSDVTGFEADVYNDSTGTVDWFYPLAAYSEINAGIVNHAAGLAIYSTYLKPGGIVYNNYGILIADQNVAGANNLAIKTGKGPVQFGDLVKLDLISDPPCKVGDFFIWASSSSKKLRKCENGSVGDL